MIRNNENSGPGQSGHARPEILVSFVLVGISVSMATPFYNQYGWVGWILGSILVFAGIVAMLFLIAGGLWFAGRINMALKGRGWYRVAAKTFHVAVFFAGFSFFGLAILTPQVFFLDLSIRGQAVLLSVGPIITGVLITVFRFREEDRFWDEFGRFCLALMIAFICELIMTPIGISLFPASPAKGVLCSVAGIALPMGIYFVRLRRRLQQPPETE